MAADWTPENSELQRVTIKEKKRKKRLGKQSERDKEDAWHPRNTETENTSFVLVVKEKSRVKNSETGLSCADTKDTKNKNESLLNESASRRAAQYLVKQAIRDECVCLWRSQ